MAEPAKLLSNGDIDGADTDIQKPYGSGGRFREVIFAIAHIGAPVHDPHVDAAVEADPDTDAAGKRLVSDA
jgi:hypothetical protein